VYISRDVVFDEHVFSFAHLHPNASARLRAKLSILPDALINHDARFWDTILLDCCDDNSPSTNCGTGSSTFVDDTGERGGSFDENPGSNDRHFMCSPAGDNGDTCLEADPSGDDASVSSGSYSRFAWDLCPRREAPAPALVGSSSLASPPQSTVPPPIMP
jgi:hypothetical protein